MHLGDYAEDFADLNVKFTTRTTAGVPSTLSSGAVAVYKSNDTTQSTAGITLSADFDSVTGLNNVNVDLSADAFYATGEDYAIVLTAGTVNSVSVVGEVIATFSIEARYMRGTDSANTTTPPTAAAIRSEIDSNSTGLSAIETDTQDIQSRLPAALVSGKMDADMTAISGSTAAADNLEESTTGIVTGAAQTGTLSTTQMSTDLSEATDDHYIGRTVLWVTGSLAGQASDITDYAGTNGVLTFSTVTEAPSDGDTFVIV